LHWFETNVIYSLYIIETTEKKFTLVLNIPLKI